MTRKQMRELNRQENILRMKMIPAVSPTGFICKQCEQPSPVGVGYATSDDFVYNVDACPCGWSVNPNA